MGRAIRYLSGIAGRLAERLFRQDDAFAAGNGWQTEVLRGGFARSYRDPRFDTLAQCGSCSGSGQIGDRNCSRCHGTGRIALTGQAKAGKERVP